VIWIVIGLVLAKVAALAFGYRALSAFIDLQEPGRFS